MAKPRKFSQRELGIFGQALLMAEDSVSDYFRLSEAAWRRYPYEVRTLKDLQPQEVTPKALAQVLRLRQNQRPGRLRHWDFFRICVQDHNLIGLKMREDAGDLFLPLLTYVVAHELVHVVRFYRFQHLFEATGQEQRAEEATVHEITAQALKGSGLGGLDHILQLYQRHPGTSDHHAYL